MCNCIANKTQELKVKVTELVEETTTIDDWENKGEFQYRDTKEGTPTVVLPFVYSYTRRKYDGEPERRVTNGYINVLPIFCPFCGEILAVRTTRV